ncbi:MAG: hypothetical protein MHMPM18_003464, partial [Marteilia pararefringens]
MFYNSLSAKNTNIISSRIIHTADNFYGDPLLQGKERRIVSSENHIERASTTKICERHSEIESSNNCKDLRRSLVGSTNLIHLFRTISMNQTIGFVYLIANAKKSEK